MAEFTANNQISAATNTTFFFTNYGYHPRFNDEQTKTPKTPQSLDAQNFIRTMLQQREHLETEMRVAQDLYETSHNKYRTTASAYQVRDTELLSAKNIRTVREARKIGWKRLGPSMIEIIFSPSTYCIKLPATVHLHPVFHISL